MLDLARRFVEAFGSRLYLYHAVPPGMGPDEREERLDALRETLAGRGVVREEAVEAAGDGRGPGEGRAPADGRGLGNGRTSEDGTPTSGERTPARAQPPEPSEHILHVDETDDVVGRIVTLSSDYDLVLLGASREGWFRKIVAGTIPERIARASRGRLLLVKHRRSAIRHTLLDTIEFFRSKEPASR